MQITKTRLTNNNRIDFFWQSDWSPYSVLRPPLGDEAAVGGASGDGGLEGVVAELAEENGVGKVGHAGGGITGIVAAAAAGDGSFGVTAVRKIGVVVATAVVNSGDGGGGGGIVEVAVDGGNDKNGGLG